VRGLSPANRLVGRWSDVSSSSDSEDEGESLRRLLLVVFCRSDEVEVRLALIEVRGFAEAIGLVKTAARAPPLGVAEFRLFFRPVMLFRLA
jgi:hypothetical protein